MRDRILRFMAGRYGTDQLNRFLSVAALAALLLNLFLRVGLLWLLALALLGLLYYRTLSRDHAKRRAENARYLQVRARVLAPFANLRDRWRMRKDYVFFRCPACRAMLRLPRGKGKLRVTCRKCGNAVERKS